MRAASRRVRVAAAAVILTAAACSNATSNDAGVTTTLPPSTTLDDYVLYYTWCTGEMNSVVAEEMRLSAQFPGRNITEIVRFYGSQTPAARAAFDAYGRGLSKYYAEGERAAMLEIESIVEVACGQPDVLEQITGYTDPDELPPPLVYVSTTADW